MVNKQQVIELYESGLSCNQIARQLNCSKFPVLQALKDTPKRNVGSYPHCRNKNQTGKNNPYWKGGIKSVYNRFRDLTDYWNWRKSVLDRDENKCTKCGSNKKLHAHHKIFLKTLIKQYCINKTIEDLTIEDLKNPFFYDVDNGLTLCENCHKKWHKLHGR